MRQCLNLWLSVLMSHVRLSCMFLSVFLCLYLTVCPPLGPSNYLTIYLSVHLSIRSSVCPSSAEGENTKVFSRATNQSQQSSAPPPPLLSWMLRRKEKVQGKGRKIPDMRYHQPIHPPSILQGHNPHD